MGFGFILCYLIKLKDDFGRSDSLGNWTVRVYVGFFSAVVSVCYWIALFSSVFVVSSFG